MTMQFQGFKPQALERIAGTMGFSGDMEKFGGYLEENPEAKQRMDMYNKKAIDMMNGGMVRRNYAHGGPVEEHSNVPQIKKDTIDRMKAPALPTAGAVTATGTVAQANQDVASTAGQVGATDPAGTVTKGTAAQAAAFDPRNEFRILGDPRIDGGPTGDPRFPAMYSQPPMGSGIAKVDPTKTAGTIEGTLDKTDAQTGTVGDTSVVDAAQQTESSVSGMDAAQGESVDVADVAQRKMEIGERIDPVADAASASKFTEEVQAATATPSEKATVQGQLGELMQDFEGGATPAWAAGALRNATAAMAARGLGASSMAGQALVQAAMEASLPIAQADAATFAGFETQNLSNRQQRAMLAAQQRATFMGQEFDQGFQSRVANAAKISDIANMNFTADQGVALENSRAANTMSLNNLSNKQAMVMGEVSALANLDMANLSNRQQAAVQNAQTFLATDMANLNNKQQTEMFKAQSRTQSLFTDQAADNAAKQFNATSENQSDQFFANLKTQTSQFNTSQKNAMDQFNAGESNTMSKFNTEVSNQRDQFNASNGLVIAQSNAVWRREIATASTAAVNRANEVNATNVLDMSNQAYSNMWQEHADLMKFAWDGADNERDRQNAVTLSHLAAGQARSQAEYAADLESSNSIGDFVGNLALGYATSFIPGLKDIL